MKSFKLIIAALALSMAVTVTSNAQQKKGGMSPEQRIERIEQAVGSLSDEQKEKIKDIIAKAAEEMRSVPKEERKEKMGSMMREQNAKIREVLTPEQQKKFDSMQQGGNGGGRKKKKDN